MRIPECTSFEPDALVYCGEEASDDCLEVPDPVIVVEMLSPGTQMTDMRASRLFQSAKRPPLPHR
ncbi:MAG: Uma2 family endonuclease [Rhodomicrobium sp.]